jgi:hypothetical protein
MDRPIIYDLELPRAFDVLSGWKDALRGVALLAADALTGGAPAPPTVASGFVATPTSPVSLSVNLSAGTIYTLAPMDASAYSDLGTDETMVLQQGWAPAQTITLSTSALSLGQSQWALIEVAYAQQDVIRTGDPSNGVLPYENPADPTQPFVGQNNTGATQPTVRQGAAVVRVAYGPPAPTGSEVPPGVDAGYVPLYLIDLNYAQTTIVSSEIKLAGPQAYAGYQQAPFLAGLLASHHSGVLGQAPQIDLTREVRNVLPLANLPATNTVGLLPTVRTGTGSPQGVVAGNQGDLYLATATGVLWVCVVTGTATTASWSQVTQTGIVLPPFSNGALAGPLLSAVTAGGGITVTPPPQSGTGTQQIAVANIPDAALAGPLLSAVTAGGGITVTPPPQSGTGTQQIAATDLGHLFQTTGYDRLPGGLIIQWIVGPYLGANLGGDGLETTYTFNWPVTFPNACLAAYVSMDVGGWTGTTDIWAQTAGWTAASVTAAIQYPGGGSTVSWGNPRLIMLGIGY